jgi:Rieske Fe-S protein
MEISNGKRMGRREMLTIMGGLLMLPLSGIWVSMVERNKKQAEQKRLELPVSEIPQGISHQPGCVIVRDGDRFKVHSTRCTHLGCRLKEAGHERLVCPCHGSEFELFTGVPVKGPAEKQLERLYHELAGELLTIYIR